MSELRRQSCISVDTETTSASPTQADIVGFSFAWKPGEDGLDFWQFADAPRRRVVPPAWKESEPVARGR